MTFLKNISRTMAVVVAIAALASCSKVDNDEQSAAPVTAPAPQENAAPPPPAPAATPASPEEGGKPISITGYDSGVSGSAAPSAGFGDYAPGLAGSPAPSASYSEVEAQARARIEAERQRRRAELERRSRERERASAEAEARRAEAEMQAFREEMRAADEASLAELEKQLEATKAQPQESTPGSGMTDDSASWQQFQKQKVDPELEELLTGSASVASSKTRELIAPAAAPPPRSKPVAKAKPAPRPVEKKRARQKAQNSGLLALQEQFAELLDAPPSEPNTRITRYPSVETQAQVEVEQSFSVLVSLTEDQLTPEVVIKQGSQTAEGQLALNLPKDAARVENNQLVWDIDVVLSAPGFRFTGEDRQRIALPLQGDSAPALFTLKAKPIDAAQKARKLYVTFWHKGAYLAKVIRPVMVINPALTQAAAVAAPTEITAAPSTATAQNVAALNMDLGVEAPDLTLWLQHHVSDNPDEVLVLMHSPYLQPTSYRWLLPKGLRKALNNRYFRISRLDRGDYRDGEFHPTPAQVAANVATLTGFGREVYQHYAPAAFKEAFWTLRDKLGRDFDSIQVFSNDPLLPWELMRPQRGKEETDFLGVDFRLARWHVSDGGLQLDRPPQQLLMNELMLIAPEYKDRPLSQVAKKERLALRALTEVRQIDGDAQLFTRLLQGNEKLQGIVHFAGHGVVQTGHGGIPEYAIMFGEKPMDLMMVRGMTRPHSDNHPFYFFNACDIGQAQQVANFVEGWAPSVLEAGASGYVGGLWPLDDQGAAEFASQFYARIKQQLPSNEVTVSDLLRATRKEFYRNGNPTFLAYVYYGDPHLRMIRQ